MKPVEQKVQSRARFPRLATAVLVLLLVVACGVQPILIDDLPIYAGATALQPGQNSLADSLVTTMKQSAGEQGLNAEFRLFSLPAGTTWDDVQQFYSQEMARLKWKAEPTMSVEGEGFQAVGWSQGSGDSQQALMVGYVPDVSGEGAFAVLGLFGK
jgi:hypothetical protein